MNESRLACGRRCLVELSRYAHEVHLGLQHMYPTSGCGRSVLVSLQSLAGGVCASVRASRFCRLVAERVADAVRVRQRDVAAVIVHVTQCDRDNEMRNE